VIVYGETMGPERGWAWIGIMPALVLIALVTVAVLLSTAASAAQGSGCGGG
jgi:hypothetical protein